MIYPKIQGGVRFCTAFNNGHMLHWTHNRGELKFCTINNTTKICIFIFTLLPGLIVRRGKWSKSHRRFWARFQASACFSSNIQGSSVFSTQKCSLTYFGFIQRYSRTKKKKKPREARKRDFDEENTGIAKGHFTSFPPSGASFPCGGERWPLKKKRCKSRAPWANRRFPEFPYGPPFSSLVCNLECSLGLRLLLRTE